MISVNSIEDFNRFFSARTLHPQVSAVDLSQADNLLFEAKIYDMYALMLIQEMPGKLYRDGKLMSHLSGALVTIRPGQYLEMRMPAAEKPRGWMLAFKQDLLEKTGLGRDFYMFSYFHSEYSEAIALTDMERRVICNCFANLNAELHTQQDYLSGQMIRLGIGTLLSYVKRYFEKQHTCNPLKTETWVGKLDALLAKYMGSGLPAQHGQPSVTWCATKLGLSPGYFSDLIKKELHITAQEYIRSKVIDHAKVLLRQTNMTINEIAEELGFRYPNHFTRMFHNATGYPPLKYRKGN